MDNESKLLSLFIALIFLIKFSKVIMTINELDIKKEIIICRESH